MKLSSKWQSKICHQSLTRQETCLFYQCFYLPSIRYHLTVGTFTHAQLDHVQHPIIQSILPKLGYNPNMPKALIYGAIHSGGLGFHHLTVIQALQKIKNILFVYRNDTPLKSILHTTFQWAKKVSGLSTNIFMHPEVKIPALKQERWIETLR